MNLPKKKLALLYSVILVSALLFWTAVTVQNNSRILVLYKPNQINQKLYGFIVYKDQYLNPVAMDISLDRECRVISPPAIGQMATLSAWMRFEKYFPYYLSSMYLYASLCFIWMAYYKSKKDTSYKLYAITIAMCISCVLIYLIIPFDKHVNILYNNVYYKIDSYSNRSLTDYDSYDHEKLPESIDITKMEQYFDMSNIDEILWVFGGVYEFNFSRGGISYNSNPKYAQLQYITSTNFNSNEQSNNQIRNNVFTIVSTNNKDFNNTIRWSIKDTQISTREKTLDPLPFIIPKGYFSKVKYFIPIYCILFLLHFLMVYIKNKNGIISAFFSALGVIAFPIGCFMGLVLMDKNNSTSSTLIYLSVLNLFIAFAFYSIIVFT